MCSISSQPCSSQTNASSASINVFTSSDPAYIFLDAKSRRPNRYMLTPMPATLDGTTNILFPYCDDSEYWHEAWKRLIRERQMLLRRIVSFQIQHIVIPHPQMFVHGDYAQYCQQHHLPIRHDVLQSGLAPFDYLQSLIRTYDPCGLQVSLSRSLDQYYLADLPSCLFLEYGFFILVDQYPQLSGDFLLDYDYLVRNDGIEMTKRLRARHHIFGDTCPTRWVLTINDIPYRIDLAKADLGAIHGVASLEKFASAVGIPMQDKGFMHSGTPKHIEVMHHTYQDFPIENDRYGVTDVTVPYRAFVANAENLRQVYRALGYEDYYDGESSLTIGKTVLNLFKSALFAHCEIAADDKKQQQALIEQYCIPGSAWYFSRHIETSAMLASKDFGGRCYCPRPTLTRVQGSWCDIDGKGAYARSQQQQLYALGIPFVYSYKLANRYTKHLTLRQFLAKYGKYLVAGLWYAVVSSPLDQELTYGQDIIPSYFDFRLRDLRTQVPLGMIDDQESDEELNANTGTVKILSHQILNGPITHDFIQMLYAVMSEGQREELLDSLRVETAVFYPANKRVDSLAELYSRYGAHDGESFNTIVEHDDHLENHQVDSEGYYWYGANLGELLVTKLLAERYKHKSKSPLNEQLKLCINTLFGDMVSPFFTTSNIVVANNICARTRHFIWYTEKGLYTAQSITDGGMFDLNQVPYGRDHRSLTGDMVTLLMDANDIAAERHLQLRPLAGYKHIEVRKDHKSVALLCHSDNGDIHTYEDDAAKQFVNKAALDHVQQAFPGDIDVLRDNQFEYDVKNFYTTVTFHGAANYGGDGTEISMRSYEKKEHFTAELVDDKLIVGSYYDNTTPAKHFMQELDRNPTRIARSHPFAKTAILKLKAYCRNYLADHGQMPEIQPGQTIYKVGLLREFSPSQYTYRTVQQFKAILKQRQRLIANNEQSFESYFIERGKLLYEQMVLTLHRLIRGGEDDIIGALDPHHHNARTKHAKHPHLDTLRALREYVKSMLNVKNGLITDESAYADDQEDSETFRYRADD